MNLTREMPVPRKRKIDEVARGVRRDFRKPVEVDVESTRRRNGNKTHRLNGEHAVQVPAKNE